MQKFTKLNTPKYIVYKKIQLYREEFVLMTIFGLFLPFFGMRSIFLFSTGEKSYIIMM